MSHPVVIHIGFPKTATTTLQAHVFQHLRGVFYLGKFPKGPPADPRLAGFDKHVAVQIAIERDTGLISEERAASLLQAGRAAGLRTVISKEEILVACFGPRPEWNDVNLSGKVFRPFSLREVLEPLIAMCEGAGLGRPRFVATLREQADLLSSFYAECALNRYANVPEAASFPQFVDAFLNRTDISRSGILDYQDLEDELSAVAGPDNYRLIAHEWLSKDPDRYAAAWAEALMVPKEDFAAALASAPSENVRRKIGADGRPELSIEMPSIVLWLKQRLSPGRSFGIGRYINRLIGGIRLPVKTFQPDPAVIATIRARYAASNAAFLARHPDFAPMLDRAGRGPA